MPMSELAEWIAYFNVLNQEEQAEKEAEEKAKQEAAKRNSLLGE